MANVEPSIPHRIGSHYEVTRALGQGGLSHVFEVIDRRSGRRLALKRCLQTAVAANPRVLALFRQEFHVLSQVQHPNVVAVYDYGFDGDLPYYTMECLAGQAVFELAPLDWQRACAIMLDLCTPLALLHARRLVHCDITPRNVLITRDGTTKLIDFGALAWMDEPPSIVAGTPPHMPPELLARQSLDGRLDVFGLGALAYWMLSKRHAYPAESIRMLPEIWQVAPATLAELGVTLPASLDQLIMSMLSLTVSARPVQVVEVSQRLCELLGSSHSIDRSAIAAQLNTPRLVGREHVLGLFRDLQSCAQPPRREVLCLRGPKGSGRSRLLDTFALEATLAGSAVLRVQADQRGQLEFGVMAELLQAALRHAPELAAMVPAALAEAYGNDEAEPDKLANALASQDAPQVAAGHVLQALSARQSLVVLVDDLQRADVSSLRCLMAIIEEMRRAPLLLVAAVTEPAGPGARDFSALFAISHTAQLEPLSLGDTRELLASIFGEVTHLDALAAWAYRAAAGMPGACVELARYLVERKIIGFEAGQFLIPGDLSAAGIPQSFEQALDQRAATLDPRTREWLGALALVTPFGPLSVAEHVELMQLAAWSEPEGLRALDELIEATFVQLRGNTYELRSDPIRRCALAGLEPGAKQAWNRRLGQFYERRGHPRQFLAAVHYFHAGDLAKAYELALPVDGRLTGPSDPNIPVGGSALGVAMHEGLLAYAIERGAPRLEVLHLRRVLTMVGSASDPALAKHSAPLIDQLRFDTGLDLWDAAAPELDEHARLLWCLGQAYARHASVPEPERGFPVVDAIRQLAECGSALASIRIAQLDIAEFRQTAQLVSRLRTLAPVLTLSSDMLDASLERVALGVHGTEKSRKLVATLSTQPEGLPEHVWQYMLGFQHYRLGSDLAAVGDAECQVSSTFLRHHARLVPHACSVELLYALVHGDYQEASKLRRERAMAVLASQHEDQILALGLITELQLLDACGDVLELQRMVPWFEARAASFEGWKPLAALARAYYLMNCEEPVSAVLVIDEVLQLAKPWEHGAWYELRALRAEAAWLTGDPLSAQRQAQELLEYVRQAGIDMKPYTRAERALALACAQLGDEARALAVLEPLLRRSEAKVTHTIRDGQVFEARARVALLCGDESTFVEYFERVKKIYRGSQPGLGAKVERLKQAKRAQHARALPAGKKSGSVAGMRETSQLSRIQTELDRLDVEDQADYLLALLLAECNATGGHLYRIAPDGRPELIATVSAQRPNEALKQCVTDYLANVDELDEVATRVADLDQPTEAEQPVLDTADGTYLPVPLRNSSGSIRGLALLHGRSFSAYPRMPSLFAAMANALGRVTAPR